MNHFTTKTISISYVKQIQFSPICWEGGGGSGNLTFFTYQCKNEPVNKYPWKGKIDRLKKIMSLAPSWIWCFKSNSNLELQLRIKGQITIGEKNLQKHRFYRAKSISTGE